MNDIAPYSGITEGTPRGLPGGLRCVRGRTAQGTIPAGRNGSWRAFSLIEIMVTVGLLSFIVLGLLTMFNQTQRAFRNSMTYTDVLESGRLVTDMLAREMEQMAPSGTPYFTNTVRATTNFFVELSPWFRFPLLQGLPGTTFRGQPNTQDRRTNILQRFFFLSRVNQDWIGTGYEILPDYKDAPFGTLYRFSVTNRSRTSYLGLSSNFLHTLQFGPYTNLNRIADGVVHLRVTPFDNRGWPVTPLWPTNHASRMNIFRYWERYPDGSVPGSVSSYFLSNAVPAAVELELGILEKEVVEKCRSIGAENAIVQMQYLSNHVGQVHLFRQRIPVRNVSRSAYQ